jgi:hypothetical protein
MKIKIKTDVRRITIASITAVAVAGAVSGVLVFRASAGGPAYSFGSVSAMNTLPPVTNAADGIALSVKRAVWALGGDQTAARSSLRLLRSDLGATHSALYAYVPRDGTFCVNLWRRQGTCSTGETEPQLPGVEAIFSPGGPGYGQGSDVPAALAGVVNDDVASATLLAANEQIPLHVANNAFFYEFAGSADVSSMAVQLRIRYRDGTERQATFRYGGPVTPAS